MHIQESALTAPLMELKNCTFIRREGEYEPITEPVLCEQHLTIQVENGPAFQSTCIEQYLAELALGRLRTEGIIRTAADVAEIVLGKNSGGIWAHMRLACGMQELDPPILQPIPWTRS